MNIDFANLETLLASEAWATYFIGKYYFSVNTRKPRAEFGIRPHEPISISEQRTMQRENEVALFHEYIHYVHEISTVIGNLGLGLELTLKSIFSNYFDQNLSSSLNYGINPKDERFEGFVFTHLSRETINGSVEVNSKLLSIEGMNSIRAKIYVPYGETFHSLNIEVPEISTTVFEKNDYRIRRILLGKYLIYEGLAYELDREFERQRLQLPTVVRTQRCSEYTYLRQVAEYVYPGVATTVFLSLASLSLSYLDCGAQFVRMLVDISKLAQDLTAVENYLIERRRDVSHMLFNKLDDFNSAQDEIITIFDKRPRLRKAFQTICEYAKRGYILRAERPTFEVDLVFGGNFQALFNLVQVCDYMYVFNDIEEFDRDFLGTTQGDGDASQATKVLVAYDHYQKAHGLQSTEVLEANGGAKCPFYTCCNLPLREIHHTTCAQKPWRIFEISYTSDKQYCWYGQGVAEFKGHTELI